MELLIEDVKVAKEEPRFRVRALILGVAEDDYSGHLTHLYENTEFLDFQAQSIGSISSVTNREWSVETTIDTRQVSMSHIERWLASAQQNTNLPHYVQVGLVRFLGPANLMIVVHTSDAAHQNTVQQVEILAEILGINLLIFPERTTYSRNSLPSPSIFKSRLSPAGASTEAHWSSVLGALLAPFTATGLICIDWYDVECFFDNNPYLHWKQFDGNETSEVALRAGDWLESAVRSRGEGLLSELMVVFRGEQTFGMRNLSKELGRFRGLLKPDGQLIVAAPWTTISAVTYFFPTMS